MLSPINLMEKRKATESDELALAKSAAWAWLEHYRSGSDDRTMPEFDVSRTKFNPKPSRYKVEAAMKRSSNSSTHLSLLDRYETERISRQLDRINSSGRAADIKQKKKKVSTEFSFLGVVYRRRRPENDRVAAVEVGCRPWQWQSLLKT